MKSTTLRGCIASAILSLVACGESAQIGSESAALSGTESPAPLAPSEGQSTGEPQAPSEGQSTGEPQDPSEGQSTGESQDPSEGENTSEPLDLADLLRPIRAATRIPALAAAVLRGDKLVGIGAVGVRRNGDPTPVSTSDRFHLGSNTKSMTAMLLALLVEDGLVRWDSTLAEVFPEMDCMHEGYRQVTLRQLVLLQGGIVRHEDETFWHHFNWHPVQEQRAAYTQSLLCGEAGPDISPGSFCYSNESYMVVGAAIEKVTGMPYEDLLRERIFEPLGMDSECGFGAPASPGKTDQPWPHVFFFFDFLGLDSGFGSGLYFAANPAVINPADNVHCSLKGWAKFASLHLSGARNTSTFLPPEAFDVLHTPGPPIDEGTFCGKKPGFNLWAPGFMAQYSTDSSITFAMLGTNSRNCALTVLLPQENLAYLIANNCGGETCQQATRDAYSALRANVVTK